jgi:hypothetical protein
MDYTVASHTDKSKTYTVTAHDTGWSCTCVGYGYRQTCSHIKEVQQRLISELTIALSNTDPALVKYFCRSEGCGVELTGTHTFTGKCPQCYRNEVFSHA